MIFFLLGSTIYIVFRVTEVATCGLCSLPVKSNIQVVDMYRGADKSLVRPGRKQAKATEDSEFYISNLNIIIGGILVLFIYIYI